MPLGVVGALGSNVSPVSQLGRVKILRPLRLLPGIRGPEADERVLTAAAQRAS